MVGTLRGARCDAQGLCKHTCCRCSRAYGHVTRVCCACAGSWRRRFHQRWHAGARRQHDRQHRDHYGAHLAGWWAWRVAVEVAVVTRGGCREMRTDRSGPAEEDGDSNGCSSRTRRCAQRTIPLLLGRAPRWRLHEAPSGLQTLVSMLRCATNGQLLRPCVPVDALDWPCRVRCSPRTVPNVARSR